MKFLYPNLLLLLIFIPVVFTLFLYSTNKRRKILLSFLNYESLKKISPTDLRKKRQLSNLFCLVALFFLVIAISGPITGYKKTDIKREGVDIVFLLDASKSMLSQDIKPSRIKRAKLEIKELIRELKGDRTGLVVFSGEAFLQSPLTLDNSGFNLLLKGVDPLSFPVGGTNLYKAIAKGIDAFDDTSTSKVIIILTDGEENTGKDPLIISNTAKEKGITVFTAGIGSLKGAPIPLNTGGFVKDENDNIVISKVDSDILKKIADKTGGEYLGGDNSFDLKKIYKEKIRKKMSLTEFENKENIEDVNSYRIPLLISIFFMFFSFILGAEKTRFFIFLFASFFIMQPDFSYGKSLKQEGGNFYKDKNYKKAYDAWTKEQINNPDDLNLYYNIGNSAYKNEDLETAGKNYEKVIESAGKSNEGIKYRSLYNLGNVNLLKKEYDNAIKNYEDYLKKFPDDKDAENNLGIAKKLKEKKNKEDQKENKDRKENKDKNKSDKKDSKDSKSKKDKKDQSKDKQDESDQKDKKSSEKDGEKKDKPQTNKDQDINKNNSDKNKDGQTGDKSSVPINNDKSPIKPDNKSSYDILNKVKDKPLGLIPYYKKREVEKDW